MSGTRQMREEQLLDALCDRAEELFPGRYATWRVERAPGTARAVVTARQFDSDGVGVIGPVIVACDTGDVPDGALGDELFASLSRMGGPGWRPPTPRTAPPPTRHSLLAERQARRSRDSSGWLRQAAIIALAEHVAHALSSPSSGVDLLVAAGGMVGVESHRSAASHAEIEAWMVRHGLRECTEDMIGIAWFGDPKRPERAFFRGPVDKVALLARVLCSDQPAARNVRRFCDACEACGMPPVKVVLGE